MTTGERLRLLAGAGGAAGVLLLVIGTGATAGEALVNYSQLPTGTAAQHLLMDVHVEPPIVQPALSYGGGSSVIWNKISKTYSNNEKLRLRKVKKRRDEDSWFIIGGL